MLIDHFSCGETDIVEGDYLRFEWEQFRVVLASTYSNKTFVSAMTGNVTLRALYPNLSKLAYNYWVDYTLNDRSHRIDQ